MRPRPESSATSGGPPDARAGRAGGRIHAVRVGLVGAAAITLAAAAVTSERLIDGRDYVDAGGVFAGLPLVVGTTLAVGVSIWGLRRAGVSLVVGGIGMAAAAVLLLIGVDGLVPDGAGTGPRLPLLTLTLTLLGVAGLLAALERRGITVATRRPVTALTVMILAVGASAAAIPLAVDVLNEQHHPSGERPPTIDRSFTGTVVGVGPQFRGLASSRGGTVMVRSEQVTGLGPSTGSAATANTTWRFRRTDGRLLDDPVVSASSVYLRYVTWGVFGKPQGPRGRESETAAGKTITVLDLGTGARTGEFAAPSPAARVVDADTTTVVFADDEADVPAITVTDTSGRPRWRASPPPSAGECRLGHGSALGETVLLSYACRDGRVLLDHRSTATGGIRWQRTLGPGVSTCPARGLTLAGALVVATCVPTAEGSATALLGLDPTTGADRWRTAGPGGPRAADGLQRRRPSLHATLLTGGDVLLSTPGGLTEIVPSSGAVVATHRVAHPRLSRPAVSTTPRGVLLHDPATGNSDPAPTIWVD